MSKAVGVYDSGIGGYTVLKALQARFPHENWLYLQDAQHRPYGSKSQNEIVHLGKKCLDTLVAAGVKACVVACHTSSALALAELESSYDIPLVGMLRPSVRALCAEPDKPVLWLATKASVVSNRLITASRQEGFRAKACPVICSGWVEAVEQGRSDEENIAMIEATLAPHLAWIKQHRPRVFFGCTHYPWLEKSVKSVLGEELSYIDPAAWVADELAYVLASESAKPTPQEKGRVVKLSSARYIAATG